jgi:opacity protein-like surface antigen
MKIKFILAVMVFCFLTNAHSQNFFIQKSSFGMEAGYILGEFTEEVSEDTKIRSKMGAYAGVTSHFYIEDNFFIKPAVIFSYVQETIWLHLPVFLKYYVTNHLSLVAGPQGTVTVGMKTPYNSFGLDFGAGAAFDITDNLYLQARYNFELTNSRLNNVEADRSSRYNTIFAGIGYKFL